jgi:hypothetical protein
LFFSIVSHLSLTASIARASRSHSVARSMSTSSRPSKIGIVAMDTYFPKNYVAQADLEAFDKVDAGKYVKGLEQTNMAFTDDREDIYSMSLSGMFAHLDRALHALRVSIQTTPDFLRQREKFFSPNKDFFFSL